MTDASRGFDEYWARYLRYHADVRVRRLQFVATSIGLGVAVCGVVTRRISLLALASAFAFAPAGVARALWGKDPSELQGAPHYRIAAALRAWQLALTGEIESELARVAAEQGGHPAGAGGEDAMPRPNMVTDHTLH